MNKILLIAGLFLVLSTVNAGCILGDAGCDNTLSSKTNTNAGIRSNGQGISAGANVNSNGGVNVNGNNGAGIAAVRNSVISNVNKGATNVNTGKTSAITTSGKAGSSTQNSGTIASKVKGGRSGYGLGLGKSVVAVNTVNALNTGYLPNAVLPTYVNRVLPTYANGILPAVGLNGYANGLLPAAAYANGILPAVGVNSYAHPLVDGYASSYDDGYVSDYAVDSVYGK